MAAALDKIKVVDLTRTLAGPFCTMLMGDMGAEVVKIEEPPAGMRQGIGLPSLTARAPSSSRSTVTNVACPSTSRSLRA